MTDPSDSLAPPASTVERLMALPALADIPSDQLRWLAEHGELHHLDDGGVIRGGDGPLGLLLLISGRFSVRVDRDGMEREVREVTPGRITGYLPYSRITVPRGYLVADGAVEYLEIRQEDVREMTRHCYDFTAAGVHEMLDRVRVFKSDDKHQEKMAALGRLSAGLAHELNNPSSAVARAADELEIARAEVVAAALAVGAAGLSDDAREALRSFEAKLGDGAENGLSALESAELEDRLADWLDDHGMDSHLAYPLGEKGVTVVELEALMPTLDPPKLAAVLRYAAADARLRALTADISSAAARIHTLVAAVKKHTHMDRRPVVESVALAGHLSDTVTLMRAKASRKGVVIDLDVAPDVPPVAGVVADLNQVWMHLVDNAIDAAPESGRVGIELARDQDAVVVRVIDDGSGIPPKERERVFEPFYTTKEVGQGRGLGLDIVRTVVRNHRGTVEVRSAQGRTEFLVTLPAA